MKAWQLSISIIKEVHMITLRLPHDQKYVLTDQMRRSALSISNNIAEGASRSSQMDRKRFYMIARSSLVEVDNCLEVCLALSLITNEQIVGLNDHLLQCFKLLSAMLKS